jgi:hypothetical protein
VKGFLFLSDCLYREVTAMPVILRFKNYRFFFYSNEGNPLEPHHIHVRSGQKEAKLWLSPVALCRQTGSSAKEIREIITLTNVYQTLFQGAWNEYFA